VLHVKVVRSVVGWDGPCRLINALWRGPRYAGVSDGRQDGSTVRSLEFLALYLKDQKNSGRRSRCPVGAFTARPKPL